MYYFVVNPSSSSQKGLKIWKEAENTLKEKNISYKVFLLKYPGEAGEIARRLCASGEPCTVTVVGGDGTINEFVGGLTGSEDYSHITFACIPTGSGNDFARGMNLPKDPKTAIEAILDGSRTEMISIGKTKSTSIRLDEVNSSNEKTASFAVSSGFGYDAATCYAVDHTPVKKMLNQLHLGRLVYLFCALRMLIRIKPLPMKFELHTDDGSVKKLSFKKVYFTAAMNTPYEGGGFRFCPDADPASDQLDLIIAEGVSKLKVLFMLPTALPGWHRHFKGIHLLKCRSVSVAASEDSCLHVDGEHFGFCRKVTFSVYPQKLRIITGH